MFLWCMETNRRKKRIVEKWMDSIEYSQTQTNITQFIMTHSY